MIKKILVCLGTRPDVIKLAPVVQALHCDETVSIEVLHSGQHGAVTSDDLLYFGLKVDHQIQHFSDSASLGERGARILDGIAKVLTRVNPEIVVVQGDTSTAAMAAIAAHYHGCTVAHVEAGLRTHNKFSPWPEEANRKMIACCASLHFAPTQTAVDNLISEGCPYNAVYQVGNTVVDALRIVHADVHHHRKPDSRVDALIAAAQGRRILLVTAHRRENFGRGMESIASALVDVVNSTNCHVLLHHHPNSAASAAFDTVKHHRITHFDSLPYSSFIRVLASAALVMTDSGGLQEEAATLSVPLLVLRTATERTEALGPTGGVLCGTSSREIFERVRELLERLPISVKASAFSEIYGDGFAGIRIAEVLSAYKPSSDTPRINQTVSFKKTPDVTFTV